MNEIVDGKRHGYWKIRFYNALTKTHGHTFYTGNYINGVMDKYWVWYNISGIVDSYIYYIN